MQLDALKNWHGPLPSEVGLCPPELDLPLITQFDITSKQLETADYHLRNLLGKK
jgi:hypothetical protein